VSLSPPHTGGIVIGSGIGVARSRGLVTMEGLVLRTNIRMLKFTRQLGLRSSATQRTAIRCV
jgi:hypothetical protein